MRAESLNGVITATTGHGKNAAKTRRARREPIAAGEYGKSAVDDGEWFSRAARILNPHKPGTVLFLTTGLGDERLCQRYASGEVRPPAYFLRALLRSESGEQWLNATMEGCGAKWWQRVQDERRAGAAAIAAFRR